MQKSGFIKALCSDARSAEIPSEHDFFAPLIGDWDIWWTDGLHKAGRRVKSGASGSLRGFWTDTRYRTCLSYPRARSGS